VLVRSCDAVVAIGGMYGTLSEIALALKLGIPVVGLRTWRLQQPEGRRVPLLVVATPQDAVARALRAAAPSARRARTWLA
jgi:predicted Rossmann-fold nucleotide-binding protein